MPQLGRRRLLQRGVPMAPPHPSRGQNGEVVPSAGLPSVSSKRCSRRLGACSSLPVPRPLIDTCLPSPASSLVWVPAPGALLVRSPMTRALAAAAWQVGHMQARSHWHACPSTPSSQVRARHGRCSCSPACLLACLLLSRTHHPPLLWTGVGGSSAAVPPRPLAGPSGGVFAGHMTPVYPAALGRPVGVGA